jgi:hypothetical protein
MVLFCSLRLHSRPNPPPSLRWWFYPREGTLRCLQMLAVGQGSQWGKGSSRVLTILLSGGQGSLCRWLLCAHMPSSQVSVQTWSRSPGEFSHTFCWTGFSLLIVVSMQEIALELNPLVVPENPCFILELSISPSHGHTAGTGSVITRNSVCNRTEGSVPFLSGE